jgi:UDP-N-acetylmuramoyl-tripeptide--D-alanyl-D-alanine ligase
MTYCIDTRIIEPGDIFIPVKGPNFDGHDFINDALKKGAKILDVDLTQYAKAYRKKLTCSVIGITGSAGKTTTKDLLYAILSQRFNVIKTEQNQNNEIGVPLTILKADASTDILIVEMAMRHKGEIAHLSRIARPTHSIITNIGLTHMEQFQTARDIAKAKAEIFTPALPWQPTPRYAYLNHTTPFYELLKKRAERYNYTIYPFGGTDKPDQNLNLCYQIASHFDISQAEVLTGLKQFHPSDHRLAIVPLTDAITLIDDSYNANPDGVTYALQYMKHFTGRKILILGDMLELGTESEAAHQGIIPECINANIDIIFTLGPNSAKIISPDIPLYAFLDRDALHAQLLPELKHNDIVLVKGSRGMKMEDTVNWLIKQKGPTN